MLTGAFSLIAGLAAFRMLRPTADGRGPAPARPGRITGAGAGLGAMTGVLGVGGGFLAVPAPVNGVGLRMRAAVGTGLLVITANSPAALLARAGTAQDLDRTVVAPFTGAAVLGAWDGRRLAARVSGGTLRRIFAWALPAVTALMLLDVVL